MAWLPKRRVLVPFDFSEASTAAAKTGLDLVDEAQHMDLVYVVRKPHPAEPAVLWDREDERLERVRAALNDRLASDGLSDAVVHLRTGDPGHEIVALAEELDSDLIIMPSHGRHGMKRVLLGSVAERVLRFSHCPVLVLPRK